MLIHPYFLVDKRKSQVTEGQLVFYFDTPSIRLNPRCILGKDENNKFEKIISKKRKRNFLTGRIVAKQALLYYLNTKRPINSFTLLNGESLFPFFKEVSASISLSHSGKVSVATVISGHHHIGLDIEKKDHFSLDENIIPPPKTLYGYLSTKDSLKYTWVAMESLSKVLRIGFTVPLEVFALSKIHFQHQSYGLCEYVNFPNFKCLVIELGSYIFGICYFASNNFEMNIEELSKKFFKMEKENMIPKIPV